MKYPKYVEVIGTVGLPSKDCGKVIGTSKRSTSSIEMTIDFIKWGKQNLMWPPGSTTDSCKCKSCLSLKKITEEEYLVELVMNS